MDASRLGRRVLCSTATLAILTVLAGCSSRDNGLTKTDYQDLVQRTPPATSPGAQSGAAPPIPELQPVAAPPPPALEQHLVSVNVPDNQVPLKDVLIELARKVGVDLDLDPKIEGGVIIYAKDRPFSEVIERICDMANLRYTFKNNVLRIELDTMYHEQYRLDVINTVRKTTTDVATSTDVFSAVGTGGGGGSNNSSSKVDSTSTDDLWQEVDDNLKQLLSNSNPNAQPIQSNLTNRAEEPASAPAAVAVPATSPVPKAAGGAPAPAIPVPGGGTAVPVPGVNAPASSNMSAPATATYQGTSN